MAEHIRLQVATPTGLMLDVEVSSVSAPGTSGEFTVLPNHRPLLSSLRPGLLHFEKAGKETHVAVGSGFAEAGPNAVTILTERFAESSALDKQEAKLKLDEANKALSEYAHGDGYEYEHVREELDWAEARVRLLEVEPNG